MSRSHLFLIELIVVILFFAFASVITVRVFSKSFELDAETTTLNGAVMAVQTVAETDKTAAFKEIDSTPETLYFDEEWKTIDSSGAVYTLTSEVDLIGQPAGTMAVYNYTVSSNDNVIFRLQTKKYYSGETGSDSGDAAQNASGSGVN